MKIDVVCHVLRKLIGALFSELVFRSTFVTLLYTCGMQNYLSLKSRLVIVFSFGFCFLLLIHIFVFLPFSP